LFFAWHEERKIKRKAHRNTLETTEKDMRYG
jgi:hypothetical protein